MECEGCCANSVDRRSEVGERHDGCVLCISDATYDRMCLGHEFVLDCGL